MALPLYSAGNKSDIIEYAHGMNADSNTPKLNLKIYKITNESINPVRSVHALHNMHAIPMNRCQLTLSEMTPAKIPHVAKEPV